MSKIADHLRRLREECLLSQSEFAVKMGVNRMTINNYETGKRSPDIDFAVRAADFFDVTVEYICGRSEYKHKEDMEISVEKAERLIRVIELMPQSEGQQFLLDLSRFLEYAHDQEAEDSALVGAVSTLECMHAIIIGFVDIRSTVVQSSSVLLRRGISPDMVRANAKEKIMGLSDSVLNSSRSLFGSMQMINTMLQKDLEKYLNEVIQEYK